jgi:hypothetical protein
MMQNMPMVTPKRERKVRSLFFQSSCKAILKLVAVISKMRRMNKVTEFTAVKFIEQLQTTLSRFK